MLAVAMAAAPQHSIPKRCGSWAAMKGAYRLLSNHDIDPDAMQEPHRVRTRRRCAEHRRVVVAHDHTEIDLTFHRKVKGRGFIGDGRGMGFLQSTALALTPQGEVIGLLHQSWFNRPERPTGETAAARALRWRESQAWTEAIAAVGEAPEGCRFVHVADREADDFANFAASLGTGSDFVIRVQHGDRRLAGDASGFGGGSLRAAAEAGRVLGQRVLEIGAHRDQKNILTSAGRTATVELRAAEVSVKPPAGTAAAKAKAAPLQLRAVLVREIDPPADAEPVDWLLLTNLPCETAAAAWEAVDFYRCRWVIEEFHRVEKDGCLLEDAQLDDVRDFHRLAAITGVVAVRIMELRDAARAAEKDPDRDTPAVLRTLVEPGMAAVAALKNKLEPAALTVRQFFRCVARQGGHPGRKRDGMPGWKTLFKGWYDFEQMAVGYDLARQQGNCG